MDAANVDLKGFTDEFYVKLTGAHLAPVLDSLTYLRHETAVWQPITTLLRYVYTGNVHDREGSTTCCPSCSESLIVRDWHRIEDDVKERP